MRLITEATILKSIIRARIELFTSYKIVDIGAHCDESVDEPRVVSIIRIGPSYNNIIVKSKYLNVFPPFATHQF
jgi:hypothetical protein